jgi:hypothetical protein
VADPRAAPVGVGADMPTPPGADDRLPPLLDRRAPAGGGEA